MTDANVTPMRPLNILLIEDNDSDAFLVQNALETTCPGEFKIVPARSLEMALPLLAQLFDVALLDWTLPGSCGLEALGSLHRTSPQLAIVMLTGHDDEAKALESLKHGAQDYLVKERVDGHLIKRAIRYAIERKRFEDSLTVLANYDGLTGLANRSLFESRLDMALARARRSGESLAVMFLDLNGFKKVNDSLGHEAGDILLKGVGERLTKTLRECDTIARFGGDEFAVLLEGAGNPRDSAIVAQKMIDALTPPFALGEKESAIGVSIGIAIGAPAMKAETLMKQADAAMYRAKAGGQSNYKFHTENLSTAAIGRMQMEQELGAAIRHKNELCLFYQPKLDVATGRLVGAEALMRWDSHKRGLLAPQDFMHLLTPLMAAELDQWVMETVCRDIQCWQIAGMKPTQVSIHVLNHDWESAHAVETLLAVFGYAGLHPSCMAVEIEESALLHEAGDGFNVLSRVRDTGVEVHLDDFDGDISSLRLLARCPLDAIKIDRKLTADMDSKEQRAILTQALLDLGLHLGTRVVAEAGENKNQERALRIIAHDQLQSCIVSKPLPAQEFFHWLGNRSRVA